MSNLERVEQLLAELRTLTLSIEEAAEQRAVKPGTIRQYAWAGRVMLVNSGARIVINPDGIWGGAR